MRNLPEEQVVHNVAVRNPVVPVVDIKTEAQKPHRPVGPVNRFELLVDESPARLVVDLGFRVVVLEVGDGVQEVAEHNPAGHIILHKIKQPRVDHIDVQVQELAHNHGGNIPPKYILLVLADPKAGFVEQPGEKGKEMVPVNPDVLVINIPGDHKVEEVPDEGKDRLPLPVQQFGLVELPGLGAVKIRVMRPGIGMVFHRVVVIHVMQPVGPLPPLKRN